jgi:hypothetical protein
VPQESSIMNTLSDITNIENDTEVIFVHALNNFLFVFSHFRKKLVILISVANFFRKFENVLCVAFFNSVGHIISREISCINET